MSRDLHPVPLEDVIPPREGLRYITMAEGQWDALLATAYQDGWVLLELDTKERPVAAYQARRGLSDMAPR